MSFVAPSLPELISQAESDIESRISGADASVRRSNLSVLARVEAGGLYGLYGYLSWLERQRWPDKADADVVSSTHARLWLEVDRLPATAASGEASFNGIDDAWIDAGTLVQRADGTRYAVGAAVQLVSGSATVSLSAVESGAAGNALPGTALSMVSPVEGVNATSGLVLGDGLLGGADIEDAESQRARVLFRIKNPPAGGAVHDYERWALEVSGVTRAWVYPRELGAGTVTIRFVCDGLANPIPDAAMVDAVAAYIETKASVIGERVVVAPIADAVAYQIRIAPDTPAVRSAVEAELRDLHRREAIPGGVLLISHIREAVSLAAFETDNSVVFPSANVSATTGHMPTFGSVTWVP